MVDSSNEVWCSQVLHKNGSNLLFYSKLVWNFDTYFDAGSCITANCRLLVQHAFKQYHAEWKVFFAFENFVCSNSNRKPCNKFSFWTFFKAIFSHTPNLGYHSKLTAYPFIWPCRWYRLFVFTQWEYAKQWTQKYSIAMVYIWLPEFIIYYSIWTISPPIDCELNRV